MSSEGRGRLFSLFAIVAGGAMLLAGCAPPAYQGTNDAPPAPPGAVVATAGFYQVAVTWNADPSRQYNVYWGTTPGIKKTTGNRFGNVSPPFYHSNLTNGSTYYYAVTALAGGIESGESVEVSAMPVPPPPGGITVAAGDGQATVSWTPVGTANSYNLYWSTIAGISTATGSRIANVTSPHIRPGLSNGITYYFGVTAIENGTEGPISTQIGATPLAASVAIPSGVTATGGSGQITLSWSAVGGATSYNLYWGTASGVTKITGTKIAGVTSPYVHTGLSIGTAYYYVVTAVSGVESAESAVVSAVPRAWVTKTPMPTARFGLGAAMFNGIVYAIGGANNGLSSVEAYNPISDTWNTRAPMPTARYYLGAATVNGIIYAIGGICCGGRLNTVEAYDPVGNSWSTKTPMPTARNSPAVVAVNGTIYVIGGGGDVPGSIFTVVEAYDPVANTWSTKAPMPTARYGAGAASVNGIIYVIGGPGLNTVEAYDPLSNTWSTKAAMPTAREGLVAAAVNGIIYAIGGVGGLNTVEAYSPVNNSWVTVSSLPTGRGYLASEVVSNVIYAMGGTGSSILGTVEAFSPP